MHGNIGSSRALASPTTTIKAEIFDLSIFLFALELWCAVMKNDAKDSTLRTALTSFKQGAPENSANKKEKIENNRPSLEEAATYSPT